MVDKKVLFQLDGGHPVYPGLIGYIDPKSEKNGLVMFYNIQGANPYRVCVYDKDLIKIS